MLPAKTVNKNNPWWTGQLEDLRKQVTNSYKRYITNPIEGNKTRYKKLLRSYKNLCFKRKEDDRKRINESIPNEAAMAKHAKRLLGTIQPKLGTLETAQGTHTEVGEETFQELMTTHYPNHTKAKITQYREDRRTKLAELVNMYNDWINIHRVTKALGLSLIHI